MLRRVELEGKEIQRLLLRVKDAWRADILYGDKVDLKRQNFYLIGEREDVLFLISI